MPTYQDQILEQMKLQSSLLAQIAHELTTANQSARPLPYRRRLVEFGGFDWAGIGAVVYETDRQGVTEVEWCGHRYTRRSGSGKFGDAVWFSRALDEKDKYEVLIKFADYVIDALKVEPK